MSCTIGSKCVNEWPEEEDLFKACKNGLSLGSEHFDYVWRRILNSEQQLPTDQPSCTTSGQRIWIGLIFERKGCRRGSKEKEYCDIRGDEAPLLQPPQRRLNTPMTADVTRY